MIITRYNSTVLTLTMRPLSSLPFALLALPLALLHAYPATAHAQADDEAPRDRAAAAMMAPVTVTVSASKREQSLASLNGSATVVERLDLDDAQATTTLDLERVLPGVYMTYSASLLFPTITVRGVTSAQDSYNPALTVYVDGIPQLPVFASQTLLDVERVELLKGPQGTLYGKSAQGGVLNIVTRKPDDVPRLRLRGGVASRDGYQAQGEAAGALIGNLLYGAVSLAKTSAPGDLHSHTAAQAHLGGVRAEAGSARLRLAPAGSAWQAGLSGGRDCAYGKQDVYTPFDDIGSREAYVMPGVPDEYLHFQQRRCANSFSADAQYDFEHWRLTATASAQRVHIERSFPLASLYSSQPERWKQNTQELRLATRADADGASTRAWDAVFGLYRQDIDQTRRYRMDVVAPMVMAILDTASANHSESLAAYGDMTWHATARLDLSAGLRLARDRADTDFAGQQMGTAFSGRARSRQHTGLGRLSAGYQWTPQWRGYVNVSQGYKPAGFNLAPSNPGDAEGYGRERAISYEAGTRYNGRDLRASLAIYRIDTRDAQLYGDGDMGYQTLKNAGDTRSTGLEFSVDWDATRHWTLGLSGFINDATFRRYTDSSACTGCRGNDVPLVPERGLTLSATGHLRVAGAPLRPQVTLRHVGAHYFDIANTLRQDAYTLLDAALTWQAGTDLSIALYAHNLTDKAYRGYAFSYGAMGNFAQVAPGRTVGVTLTYDY